MPQLLLLLSNGHIADDPGCPQPPQTKTFSAFSTAIHSFVTGESRDFKFGTVTYHGKSHPADKKIFSEKIVVWVT